MARYSVNKYFGHFWQCWNVDAETKEEAWSIAEEKGHLQYMSVYRELKDLETNGYVVNLDEKEDEDPPISKEQYYKWMKEAIAKGMVVSQYDYEIAMGILDLNGRKIIEQ